VDLNENNKLKNFKYIFSTGDVIDSLQIIGKVVDFDKKIGLKDITVMLYDNLKDSIITKKKPYYSTKTNDKGEYTLQNLRKGKYRIIAIKDENSSLTFDENTDLIGFTDKYMEWDTTIVLTQDLEVSKAELTPRIIGNANSNYYGLAKVTLNTSLSKKPDYSLSLKMDFDDMEVKGDSLILYYYNSKTIDSFKWYLPFDTLNIYPGKKEINKDTFTLVTSTSAIRFFEKDSFFFTLNYPIKNLESSMVSISDSTNNIIPFEMAKKTNKQFYIKPKVKANKNYKITINSNAVQDIYGNINDTFSSQIKTISSELLSSINIDLINLDSTKYYLIGLEKTGNIISNTIVQRLSKVKLKYEGLKSDEYTLVVLEDNNKNGYKDASNYWLQRQAEFEKRIKLDKLKESWILEKEIDYLK
jgi:uncharacterized protein (DUF2141 family)